MDRISKALKKLTPQERLQIKDILLKLQRSILKGLDIKKLKSRNDIFRVRKGKVRILFRRTGSGDFFILVIERRAEKTYKRI